VDAVPTKRPTKKKPIMPDDVATSSADEGDALPTSRPTRKKIVQEENALLDDNVIRTKPPTKKKKAVVELDEADVPDEASPTKRPTLRAKVANDELDDNAPISTQSPAKLKSASKDNAELPPAEDLLAKKQAVDKDDEGDEQPSKIESTTVDDDGEGFTLPPPSPDDDDVSDTEAVLSPQSSKSAPQETESHPKHVGTNTATTGSPSVASDDLGLSHITGSPVSELPVRPTDLKPSLRGKLLTSPPPSSPQVEDDITSSTTNNPTHKPTKMAKTKPTLSPTHMRELNLSENDALLSNSSLVSPPALVNITKSPAWQSLAAANLTQNLTASPSIQPALTVLPQSPVANETVTSSPTLVINSTLPK